jgi:hypothetical protein
MSRAKRIRKMALLVAVVGLTGTASYATKCVPDPNPICFQIYAPVRCSNGQTYTNQCYADADCATGCHPV